MVVVVIFGLFEEIGGECNWDYCYIWVWDLAFFMYVFLWLGFWDEVQVFINWIIDCCKVFDYVGNFCLVYWVDGFDSLEEENLDYFEGYWGS